MTERIFQVEDESIVTEYMTYGGVEFPRYLVTRDTFEKKIKKVKEIMGGVAEELSKGTPSGDAGDTHGQYHNELAWYREQDLSRRTDLARSLGKGLDRAVIIDDYNEVRKRVNEAEINPENRVTLSSIVNLQYGVDADDIEQIMLVAPLDGGIKRGSVSVETPMAKAIEGKKQGEVAEFRIETQVLKVKIF